MKWDVIKRQVADEVAWAVREGRYAQEEILVDLVHSDFAVLRDLPEGKKWHGPIREAYADQVRKCIEAWDIRAVDRLRALFLSAFPATLRKCRLMAELRDDGWHVNNGSAAVC
jgi:hypothetical protein